MTATMWDQRPTALVVDDEPEICTFCASVLERNGFSVLIAPNGRDALKVYRDRQDEISVVLSDLVMAGGDGAALARDIFELNPKARIVLMSGHDSRSSVYDDLRAACVFLDKPFRKDQLEGAVARISRR